jgi:hypothetical protein
MLAYASKLKYLHSPGFTSKMIITRFSCYFCLVCALDDPIPATAAVAAVAAASAPAPTPFPSLLSLLLCAASYCLGSQAFTTASQAAKQSFMASCCSQSSQPVAWWRPLCSPYPQKQQQMAAQSPPQGLDLVSPAVQMSCVTTPVSF